MADANGRNPGDPGYDKTTDINVNPFYVPPRVNDPNNPSPVSGSVAPPPQQATDTTTNTTPPTSGGFAPPSQQDASYLNLYKQVVAALTQHGWSGSEDPNYWVGKILSGAGGSGDAGNVNYFLGRIALGPNGQPNEAGGVGSGQVDPYTNLPAPSSIANQFVAPQFAPPSVSDLLSDPGYQSRMLADFTTRQRLAAAKGSILSGGTQKALAQAGQTFATNEYQNLYQRALDAFNGNTQATFGAEGVNQQNYNTLNTNNLNQYNTRYKAYQDAIQNQFSLANLGLNATTAGRPTGTTS